MGIVLARAVCASASISLFLAGGKIAGVWARVAHRAFIGVVARLLIKMLAAPRIVPTRG
jgi:hypothetical protein